jgi:NTP pyrophosphatase (non-canonical NTP hydrolase)
LGLAGEAGEVANKVKKIYRDNDGVLRPDKADEISSELGDVLWYVAAIATDMGVNLQEIAEWNLEKLRDRKKRNVIKGEGDQR